MTAAVAPLPPRAALRVVPGGRGARPPAAVLWRRRALALALATALVVVAWWGLTAALRSTLGGPEGGTTTPGPAAAVETGVYVVQPGDTLESVARHLASGADWRATASDLVERNGTNRLEPGQRLLVG